MTGRKKYFSNNPALTDDDANVIGKFIETKFKNKVTARQLLDASRDPGSPLHGYFEWDDSKAAEQYRVKQAQKLIVSVYITADDNKPMRNFLRVTLDSGRTYLDCGSVSESQDLIDQVIESAKEQLQRWKDRYGRYCDFFNLNFEMKGKKYEVKKDDGREAGNNPRS